MHPIATEEGNRLRLLYKLACRGERPNNLLPGYTMLKAFALNISTGPVAPCKGVKVTGERMLWHSAAPLRCGAGLGTRSCFQNYRGSPDPAF